MAFKSISKSTYNKSDRSPKPAKKQPRKIEAKAPVDPSTRNQGLTIVDINASAGGLEALGDFFNSLPVDTDMTFVVFTHIHSGHESHLAKLRQNL